MWTIFALVSVGLVWAYNRWSLAIGVSLLTAITVIGMLTDNLAPALGLLIIFGCALAGVAPLRRLWTRPIKTIFKKMLPPLSETERVALEGGTVGFEGELFTGKPNWDTWRQTPYAVLSEEETAFLNTEVEQLCGMVNDWQITHVDADLSPEIWAYCKEKGFFGLIIPKEYGGKGFSALAHHKVIEKISSISPTLSSTVAVPNSLGPGELLMHYGTEEQRSYYLPRLASGQEIPCFGLTSPTAGSDATSISDTGVIGMGTWNGQEVMGLYLTFEKRYITLAPVASLIGLAFRVYDPNHLLGETEDRGITLALVPRSTPGIEIGRRHFPLNTPFQNGPITGHNVFIPLSQIIGGEAMIGKGWNMLVECLSIGRAITLPSTASGTSKMAAVVSGTYARLRKQFGLSVGRFEGVEEALARMAGHAYQISALSETAAQTVDRGEKPAVVSTIAKYHGTELGRQVVKDAMDVHGGKGIILGPKNYLGRQWQGAPIGITVEGANIMTRSLMIFGQGAILSHPWVLKEMMAVQKSDKDGDAQFDQAFTGHAGFALSHVVRSLWLGLTNANWNTAAPGSDFTHPFYQKLNRYSANLALMTDVSLLSLGGRLKFKEALSGRLGDVLSYLYIASSVLRRFEARGEPQEEQVLVSWALYDCFYKIEQALSGAIRNFPIDWIRYMVWPIVFPWGRRAQAPSDRLGHKVAASLLNEGLARTNLAANVYLTPGQNNPAGRVYHALALAIQAEPIERKWLKQLKSTPLLFLTPEEQYAYAINNGWLSADEVEILKSLRTATWDAITVDDFDTNELKSRTNQ